jgi:hypothetical protein
VKQAPNRVSASFEVDGIKGIDTGKLSRFPGGENIAAFNFPAKH